MVLLSVVPKYKNMLPLREPPLPVTCNKLSIWILPLLSRSCDPHFLNAHFLWPTFICNNLFDWTQQKVGIKEVGFDEVDWSYDPHLLPLYRDSWKGKRKWGSCDPPHLIYPCFLWWIISENVGRVTPTFVILTSFCIARCLQIESGR